MLFLLLLLSHTTVKAGHFQRLTQQKALVSGQQLNSFRFFSFLQSNYPENHVFHGNLNAAQSALIKSRLISVDSLKKYFPNTCEQFMKTHLNDVVQAVFAAPNKRIYEALLTAHPSNTGESRRYGRGSFLFYEDPAYKQRKLDDAFNAYKSGLPTLSKWEMMILDRWASKKTNRSNNSKEKEGSTFIQLTSDFELNKYIQNLKKNWGVKPETEIFNFTPLINGVKIKINYKNGVLSGIYAINIKETEIDIQNLFENDINIPKIISEKENITFFGTLSIKIGELNALNIERNKNGYESWQDTRTAIVDSILRSNDPYKNLGSSVEYYIDDYIGPENKHITLKDKLKYINRLRLNSIYKYLIQRLISEFDLVSSKYLALPFEISGIQILASSLEGSISDKVKKGHYSYWPKVSVSKVNSIQFHVMPEGVVTASIELTSLDSNDNSKMQSITICNESDYKSMNIRINDSVVTYQQQNVLPQLAYSCRDSDASFKRFPSYCPQCDSSLQKREVEGKKIAWCPTHLKCKKNTLDQILHFTSQNGLSVPSLTKEVLQDLKKVIPTINKISIFTLNPSNISSLNLPPKFKDVYNDIQKAKNTTFDKFIYALQIPSVTPTAAYELAKSAGTLKRLLVLRKSDLEKIPSIGKKHSQIVRSHLQSAEFQKEVNLLLEVGVNFPEPSEKIAKLCYNNSLSLEQYKELVKLIQEANTKYNVDDFTYDIMEESAKKFEKANPKEAISFLPKSTKSVILKTQDPLPQMYKTYSKDQMEEWLKDYQDIEMFVQPKINGIGVTLCYENGHLVSAYTRYNKNESHDVTDKIRKFTNIPTELFNFNYKGTIRGELYIPFEKLKELNKDREQAQDKAYIDGLGAVNAALKLRNKEYSLLNNSIYFQGFYIPKTQLGLSSQKEIQAFLIKHKLASSKIPYRLFKNSKEALNYLINIEARKSENPVSIDGMVLKRNEINFKAENENDILAYKFNLEYRTGKVNKLSYSTTKTGKISIVAELEEPIKFSNGRSVSRMIIYNPNNIFQGDQVTVGYIGGVVPTLIDIQTEKRKEDALPCEVLKDCPNCTKKLETRPSGSLYCVNPKCTGSKKLNTLIKFAQILGIKEVNLLENLIVEGLFQSPSDFFKLIPEELSLSLPEVSKEKINDLYLEIEKAREKVSFYKLLSSLQIPNLGKQSTQKLSETIKNFEQFLNLDEKQLSEMTFNKVMQSHILNYIYKNKSDLETIAKNTVINFEDKKAQLDINQSKIELEELEELKNENEKLIAQLNINIDKMIRANNEEKALDKLTYKAKLLKMIQGLMKKL